MEALQGGKAGAASRKLSAKGQATLARGKAAVTKHRERKLNAQRMAAPGEMQERWRKQGGGSGGQGQPALAGVSGGGGKSTRAIGKPSDMMQMARRSGVNNLAKSPDLSERIKANRNLKTRPDVKPAQSTQVPYGGDNLSQKAIEYRENWVHPKTGKKGYWKQGNIAVYEYRDGGELRTHAEKSIPRRTGKVGLHSEPAGLQALDKMGIKLNQITQVYTEREPCMSAGNYCGTLLGSELPDIPVTHSFEYRIDPNSQVAGNAALEDALKEVKRIRK